MVIDAGVNDDSNTAEMGKYVCNLTPWVVELCRGISKYDQKYNNQSFC